MSVPLALGKLALGPASKTCVCCYAEHLTSKVPEEVIRKAVGTGWLYRGTWIWMISMFPSPSDFAVCASRHQLDTCRDCLTKHFNSRLETLGTASCDAFMCPEPGCGHLAQDPEFRWCLRPGCDAGQSYDTRICETSPPDCTILMSWKRKVWCHACNFEMCYHHQTPWHHGQTCEEYDNAAKSREDDRATKRWLADHAKRCPSCNWAVQKNGGCFHMKCAHCKAQFCWLCLADWRNIQRFNSRGSDVYDPLGHKPGCFFRDSLSRPYNLIGDNQQDARRQHRANMLLGL
ncbi:ibr finger domain protein [Colletotrichum plurivorum]|uniref:RBR-type E3 ubiquitin transferase n=1 Tax=Colletotrichum plurivorum TaxID=2175906 RepID=A0A8H6K411_9PEZI|nr:ibr finger domain protein [Colletotrichum plurivorum]